MILVFGDHRLDLARRELRRGDAPVAIEPRAFDLLAFLMQHRGRVVTKDDLLQGVWGGRIVSDSALTTRINAVRRALGDDGAAQRLIRTVTGKGVRFVGEVVEVPDPATLPAEKPSLAVLPFANLSGDPKQEYFCDGMVEEITTAIARFPWLSVIARNSSFAYKGKAVDVKQVARELGVRYVLEGSVRKAGTRVRIAGQLIDTTTGAHIWAERFDGALDDIFELQDQVASGIAGAVGPELRLAEIERARRKPTASLDAYDFYLRALARCHERTRESCAEEVRLSQQALALDPGYAAVMATIAGCRCLQRNRHWIPDPGPEIEGGIRMARQAIASTRADSEVLTIAGFALAFLAGDNEAALGAIDRAIALNPNLAVAWGQRALGAGLSQPARRGDPGGRARDAAEPARTAKVHVCAGDGVRPPRRRPLRRGATVGRGSVAGKCRAARAALQAEPVRPSRPARRGRRVSAPGARKLVRADGRLDHAWPCQGCGARNPRPHGRGTAQGRRAGGVKTVGLPPVSLEIASLRSQ
jgi:TolB-like protein